jgi:hypothetical protein
MDTVARNLPTPLIFLREAIDLDTLQQRREVIDGQQRLRTVFTYVDKSLLKDFSDDSDDFMVMPEHNRELAGQSFKGLGASTRERILNYKFSVHVLPSSTEDRDVLMIFARLNSTGTTLNHQELRNAKFFGLFKTLMYQLSYEQLERWTAWSIFDTDSIARMQEVEMTSDLVVHIIRGVWGKSQPGLDRVYAEYDEQFVGSSEIARRFRLTMDAIDEVIGQQISQTVFSRTVYFVTLFSLLYDVAFGLGSPLHKSSPRPTPGGMQARLLKASRDLRAQRVPEQVLDAVQRASADIGRRRTRLNYLKQVAGVATGDGDR